jgi:hypothetical protein
MLLGRAWESISISSATIESYTDREVLPFIVGLGFRVGGVMCIKQMARNRNMLVHGFDGLNSEQTTTEVVDLTNP